MEDLNPGTWIDQAESAAQLWAELEAQTILAVDLESNGFHRYPERICLLQVGLAHRSVMLDPLALTDLAPVGRVLADPRVLKVFHACDNDLRALYRDFGFEVKHLFDTAIAAHFLGCERLGLESVLQLYMGIELVKSKALQRQDWSQRPLKPASLTYALLDVEHLIPLSRLLQEKLEGLGRWTWVLEEFERLEAIRPNETRAPEDLLWKVKGSRALEPAQRAVLRELCVFRERLARRLSFSQFRVVSDETLLALAQAPQTELGKVRGLTLVQRAQAMGDLQAALDRGQQTPGIPLPPMGKSFLPRRTGPSTHRLKLLKQWRENKGKELGLNPALLWPLRHLEYLAHEPTGIAPEADRSPWKPEVRDWQRREYAGELGSLLAGGGRK